MIFGNIINLLEPDKTKFKVGKMFAPVTSSDSDSDEIVEPAVFINRKGAGKQSAIQIDSSSTGDADVRTIRNVKPGEYFTIRKREREARQAQEKCRFETESIPPTPNPNPDTQRQEDEQEPSDKKSKPKAKRAKRRPGYIMGSKIKRRRTRSNK